VASALLAWAAIAPAAADLNVVVTIKPLHSLVAHVMNGAGTPDLLVGGASSPHTYSLKPSEAARLNQAHVFFRMSGAMEPFTAKIVKSLPKRVQVATLQDTKGLALLPRRTGGAFEEHGHGQGHGHGHKHDSDSVDGHAWLDPTNAKLMADRIAEVLASKEPARAELFRNNATALKAKLDALQTELAGKLEPLAGKPYVVFHDALQYFERRFNLKVVGAISVNPEVPPSAKRLSSLRKRVASLGATCVFAEPQFDARLVGNLIEGTQARTGTLDPEGGNIAAGPDHYFELLRGIARDLAACLAPA
jgi:zinc transport system substrate-binding protein